MKPIAAALASLTVLLLPMHVGADLKLTRAPILGVPMPKAAFLKQPRARQARKEVHCNFGIDGSCGSVWHRQQQPSCVSCMAATS
jgi:hypothetical protein